MLANGDGVPIDPPRARAALERARQLWAEACAHGDARACEEAADVSRP